MSKLLTVSVAAYNVERFLRKTLDSFANDSLNDYLEVLVIDDGGRDTSLDIAKEYQQKYPEIFIPVHKENGGWGSTVNYSICHASGKFFRILDGDDYFNLEDVERFVEYLKTCDSDLIITPHTTFEDQTDKVLQITDSADEYEVGKDYLLSDIAENIPLEMWESTFKTDILKNNNVSICEHCFYTDGEFVVKAGVKCKTVSFCDVNLYQYRVAREGQSVSNSGFVKNWRDNQRIIERLYEDVDVDAMCENIKCMYVNRVQHMVDTQYNVYWLLDATKSNKDLLREFDKYIKVNFALNYELVPYYIKMARTINFNGYLCMKLIKKANKILRKNK